MTVKKRESATGNGLDTNTRGERCREASQRDANSTGRSQSVTR